jgi:subtilisin family serine protease
MEPSEVRRRALRLLAVSAAVVTAGAMASGSPAAAAPAEGQILGAGTADVVPGSYIVALKANAARTSAQSLAGRYGGSVKQTYSHALNGFAANLSEAQAKRLAADPSVEYVQADGIYTISGSQTNPPSWGLDRIDQRDLPLNQTYNYPDVTQTVTAYVIDTGIPTTHSTFAGRAKWGTNAVDTNSTDCHGHGTHVAGTIGGNEYGVAKTVQLVAVKVLRHERHRCSNPRSGHGDQQHHDQWLQPQRVGVRLGRGARRAHLAR